MPGFPRIGEQCRHVCREPAEIFAEAVDVSFGFFLPGELFVNADMLEVRYAKSAPAILMSKSEKVGQTALL